MKSFTLGLFLTWYILIQIKLTVNSSTTQLEAKCPEILNKTIRGNCDRVSCESIVKEKLCPSDTIYVPRFSLCHCCPKCVKYLPLENDPDIEPCVTDEEDIEWIPDEDCIDDNHCPVKVNKCLPGLICNETQVCVEPGSDTIPDHETEECLFRKSLRRSTTFSDPDLSFVEPYLHHWDPICEADGSFSPKQCKGTHFSGECYCVNRAGTRIFGREWRLTSENQTCACSRRMHDLREQNLIATLHCTPDGNFEPLQCDSDSGICYCVDPLTGELDGSALPEKDWKFLPCYHVNLTDGHEDGMYMRKCESEYAAAKAILIFGKYHGIRLELKMPKCDGDGSYAPVQVLGTTHQCVFQNGSKIRDYSKPTTTAMDCQCGRDTEQYFPSQQVPNRLACEQGTGNYEIAYDFGSYSSCVDQDGFMYGDLTLSKHFCCLLDEGCSDSIKASCYNNETMLENIKPCKFWRYRN